MSLCPIPEDREQHDLYVSERLSDVISSFHKVFGENLGIYDREGVLKGSIKSNLKKISDLKDELVDAKFNKDIKLQSDIRNNIKELEKINKDLALEVSNHKKKIPVIERLESIITQSIIELMDARLYDSNFNPEIYMNMIKEGMIETTQSKTFNSLDELPLSNLRAAEVMIKRKIDKHKKLSAKMPEEQKIGLWADTYWQPEVTASEWDPSGRVF